MNKQLIIELYPLNLKFDILVNFMGHFSKSYFWTQVLFIVSQRNKKCVTLKCKKLFCMFHVWARSKVKTMTVFGCKNDPDSCMRFFRKSYNPNKIIYIHIDRLDSNISSTRAILSCYFQDIKPSSSILQQEQPSLLLNQEMVRFWKNNIPI